MKFIETKLKGSYIIQIETNEDIRGFFARTFDIDEFKNHGIDFNIVQTSISYNKKKGTIRGMHYQEKPYQEAKFIQCLRGLIYDVIIDLREHSLTKNEWISVELSDKEYNILYVPKGFAHGFQTLENDTLTLYYIDEFYHSEFSKVIYYNDKKYDIEWKLPLTSISEKDMISKI